MLTTICEQAALPRLALVKLILHDRRSGTPDVGQHIAIDDHRAVDDHHGLYPGCLL